MSEEPARASNRTASPSEVTNLTVSTVDSGQPPTHVKGPPEQFGRYRILKKLGEGGMGAVYLAHDSQLDRRVALKVLRSQATQSPDRVERLRREARAAASLSHPNLCPVFDVGEFEGSHYLTMAYVEGRTLADLLNEGRPTTGVTVKLLRSVALAVAEAHRIGVIHRDLKPANIMINSTGDPVVMDFGLARRTGSEDVQLTQEGAILGTPAYMPPEQVRAGREVGPTADVYSLGVVLYQMITGRLPFKGDLGTVIVHILTQEPPLPSAVCPEVPPMLETVCRKAMSKKVEDRYPSMEAFADALATCDLSENSATALPAPVAPPERPRRKLLIALAALFGASLLAGVIVVRIKDKDGKEKVIEVPEGGSVRVEENGKTVAEVPRKTVPGIVLPANGDPEYASWDAHKGDVYALAFSPNGAIVVSGGKDGTLLAWDLKNKKPVGEPKDLEAPVNVLAFAPDGASFASGGADGVVRIWETATLKARKLGEVKEAAVSALRFAPDGKTLAVGSNHGLVEVWEVESGKVISNCKGHPHSVTGLDFSEDGAILATASRDGSARLWEAKSGKRLATWQGEGKVNEGGTSEIAFTPDGRLAFSNCRDMVHRWDLKEGKESTMTMRTPKSLRGLALSADGKILAVGGELGTWEAVKVWDVTTSKELATIKGENGGWLATMALSPDGKIVVTAADHSPRIVFWEAATGNKLTQYQEHARPVHWLAFSPDGSALASADEAGTVKVWNVARAIKK